MTGSNIASATITSTNMAANSIDATTMIFNLLPINRGGTNTNATPTAGAIAYGTGTAIAYTPTVGTAGQVLTSAGGCAGLAGMMRRAKRIWLRPQ